MKATHRKSHGTNLLNIHTTVHPCETMHGNRTVRTIEMNSLRCPYYPGYRENNEFISMVRTHLY